MILKKVVLKITDPYMKRSSNANGFRYPGRLQRACAVWAFNHRGFIQKLKNPPQIDWGGKLL